MHVSSVTMILEVSIALVGTSETKMGLKTGGGGEAAMLAGNDGTRGASPALDGGAIFKDVRKDGGDGGMCGGGARVRRGGDVEVSDWRMRESPFSGNGSGGRGGLFGGDGSSSRRDEDSPLSYADASSSNSSPGFSS